MSSPLLIDAKLKRFRRVLVALALITISVGCAANDLDGNFNSEDRFDQEGPVDATQSREESEGISPDPETGGYDTEPHESEPPSAGTDGAIDLDDPNEQSAQSNEYDRCRGYVIRFEDKEECLMPNEAGCHELDQYLPECKDMDGDCLGDCMIFWPVFSYGFSLNSNCLK